jgi:inorganic triphosphatase YgiF
LSEIETAFMILSTNYDQIFTIIDQLISDEGYKTEKNGIQTIHDTYFDTKDEILKNHESALRIREIDKQDSIITLKMLKNTTKNYSERIELEDTYSKEMLNQIIVKINSHLNLNIVNTSLKYDKTDHKLNLIKLGFKTIQNRRTHRKIINATGKNSAQTEYEFVFDTTKYIFENHKSSSITSIELEIELKFSKNITTLDNFVRKLKMNPSLKFWPYNKLLTGKVIEILLNNHDLKEHKDYDDRKILTLSGLEKIEKYIKSRNI